MGQHQQMLIYQHRRRFLSLQQYLIRKPQDRPVSQWQCYCYKLFLILMIMVMGHVENLHIYASHIEIQLQQAESHLRKHQNYYCRCCYGVENRISIAKNAPRRYLHISLHWAFLANLLQLTVYNCLFFESSDHNQYLCIISIRFLMINKFLICDTLAINFKISIFTIISQLTKRFTNILNQFITITAIVITNIN